MIYLATDWALPEVTFVHVPPPEPEDISFIEEESWASPSQPLSGGRYPNLLRFSYQRKWNRLPSGLLSPQSESVSQSPLSDPWAALSGSIMFNNTAQLRALYGLDDPVPHAPLPTGSRDEPVIGFRGWRVGIVDSPHVQLLSTAISNNAWHPTGPTEAVCHAGGLRYYKDGAGKPAHPAPADDCGCGLWVVARLDDVPGHVGGLVGGKAGRVIGAVIGWGEVVQHSDEGWRAQFARPIAFLADPWLDDTITTLAQQYQVPVFSTTRGLTLYAQEFGKSLPGQ